MAREAASAPGFAGESAKRSACLLRKHISEWALHTGWLRIQRLEKGMAKKKDPKSQCRPEVLPLSRVLLNRSENEESDRAHHEDYAVQSHGGRVANCSTVCEVPWRLPAGFLGVGLGVGGELEVGDERGQVAGVSCLVEDDVEVGEDLVDGHGVHFAAVIVAGLDGLLEVVTGDLRGEGVGDDVAGALFLLDPCGARHGNPNGTAVDVEANIDGVGMAGGDGDDISGPAAAEGFSGPAVGNAKVFVHGCV